MKRLTMILVAVATIGTFGNFAFGQGEGADNQLHSFSFLENLSMVIMPDGRAVERKIMDPAVSDTILKHAKPLEAGVILFMHDGKIFMTRDKAMPGGKMLSSAIMQPAP